VVRQFFEPLESKLESAKAAPRVEETTDEVCDKCGKAMVIRWGRYGRFLACSGFPDCRNSRPLEGDGGAPEPTKETCDLCQSPMVLRQGRYGRFLACSRYPDCKGTKKIFTKVGVACPKDSGDIVERRTKKGRIFFGCANYPECDFTSWSRPLPEPCPQCGGLIVVAGGKRGETTARCTACDWKGTAPERELAGATA
jgi:DNA topoisomerase-1